MNDVTGTSRVQFGGGCGGGGSATWRRATANCQGGGGGTAAGRRDAGGDRTPRRTHPNRARGIPLMFTVGFSLVPSSAEPARSQPKS